MKYSLLIYYNDNYSKWLKNVITFLNNFLQGFCFKLVLEGKKFKFVINNFHVFLKMDLSHFKYLFLKYSFFLKKLKKNKKLFFYSYNIKFIKCNLLSIEYFKKPTKYKKKGFFLEQIF